MKRISASGRLYKSAILIAVGFVILYFSAPRMFDNLFVFFVTVIVFIIVVIRILTRRLYFDKNNIKLGSKIHKIEDISTIRWFGYNFEYYIILGIKNQNIFHRYRFVDLKIIDLFEVFKVVSKRQDKFALQEFEELLKEKTNIPHKRIEKVIRGN